MLLKFVYPLLLVSTLLLVSLVKEWCWIIDFSILNLGTLTMSYSVVLDKQASAFILTVSWIFIMVYLYSLSYLSSEVYIKRFLGILFLFVLSMCVLILSGNLFSSLIGWDGLGVTSLYLILFYYSSSSYKASTLTFLMNRVGDCFFILALTTTLLLSTSQVIYSTISFSQELSLLLILTSITKSAQIPFSTWLPAAMEAPTPVSALVHSSTLVTAGIFLLYRYSLIWVNSSFKDLLLILSVGTCFMAALSALVETDLKKLIALSTLSQLGFIMFSFSLGSLAQGFFHLLMHAFFKALLFMGAGLMIHSFKGWQNISMMSISEKQNPLLMGIMSYSLLSMMGLPFMAGFYSKDYIIDSLKSSEWAVVIITLLVLSFVCTVAYSTRVIWYLLKSSSNWHSMSDSEYKMVKPMVSLAILSCIGGSVTCWLILEVEMFVDSSKIALLASLVISAISYWLVKTVVTSEFLESKWGLSVLNPISSSLFFKLSLFYQSSSDLQGVPEIYNNCIKRSLSMVGNLMSSSMIHYSGSLEFLLFLLILVFVIW